MLGAERNCRKSSHKARAQDVCSSIKSERGHVRDSEGKVFSGKVSIVPADFSLNSGNGEFEVQTLFPISDGYGVTRFVS